MLGENQISPGEVQGSEEQLFIEERWEQLVAMPEPRSELPAAWFRRGVALAELNKCERAIPALERGLDPGAETAYWLECCYASEAKSATARIRAAQPHFPERGREIRRCFGFGGEGFSGAAAAGGAVFADFDRYGRLDVAVTAIGERIELWWNRSPRKHWLQLRLKGKLSNHSAIGAQVTCKSASRAQSRSLTICVG